MKKWLRARLCRLFGHEWEEISNCQLDGSADHLCLHCERWKSRADGPRVYVVIAADDGQPVDVEHVEIVARLTNGTDLQAVQRLLQSCKRPARAWMEKR